MNINVADEIVLVGKTRHGKNRIQQHGMLWFVKEVSEIRMLLESECKTEGPEITRVLIGVGLKCKTTPTLLGQKRLTKQGPHSKVRKN